MNAAGTSRSTTRAHQRAAGRRARSARVAGCRVVPPLRSQRPELPVVAVAVAAAVFAGLGLLELVPQLGAATWANDEVGYRDAGRQYLQGHFTLNREHPFLVKYLFGLAQILAGPDPASVRAVSVGAALATGIVLFWFGRDVGGARLGALAAGLWLVLPHPVQTGVRLSSIEPKVERFALLDPTMALFMAVALWLGWRWSTTHRLSWALLTGGAFGLAISAKAAGALVAPVIIASTLLLAPDRRAWLRQAAAAGALALAVVLAVYAPDLRHMLGDLAQILSTAQEQQARGHAVIVAGQLYRTAPWWSLLYWQWGGQGTTLTVVIVLLVAIAVSCCRGRPCALAGYLLAAVLVPFLYLSFAVGFELSHYLLAYQAPLDLLAAIGLLSLIEAPGWRRRVVAGLLMLPVGAGGISAASRELTARPQDYALLPAILGPRPPDCRDLVVQGSTFTTHAYLPSYHVVAAGAPVRGPICALVVDERYVSSLPAYGPARTTPADQRRAGPLRVYLRPGGVQAGRPVSGQRARGGPAPAVPTR